MPNVGGKQFPYTPEGEAAAADYAQQTGAPFKMKNPLLARSVKTGESIVGSFASPVRQEVKQKSKDPIGDWLRQAGKQLKSDLGTLKSKVETGAQKLTSKVASDVSELAKTDVPKKFIKDVGNLKTKVETGVQKQTSKLASDISTLSKTDVPKKFVSDVSNLVTKVKSKIPKSKKSETHKRVLKNPFNVGQGYKWVKK